MWCKRLFHIIASHCVIFRKTKGDYNIYLYFLWILRLVLTEAKLVQIEFNLDAAWTRSGSQIPSEKRARRCAISSAWKKCANPCIWGCLTERRSAIRFRFRAMSNPHENAAARRVEKRNTGPAMVSMVTHTVDFPGKRLIQYSFGRRAVAYIYANI